MNRGTSRFSSDDGVCGSRPLSAGTLLEVDARSALGVVVMDGSRKMNETSTCMGCRRSRTLCRAFYLMSSLSRQLGFCPVIDYVIVSAIVQIMTAR